MDGYLMIHYYRIKSDRRDEYLQIMKIIREHIRKMDLSYYGLFEDEREKNCFKEVFVFDSHLSYEMRKRSDMSVETEKAYNKLNDLIEGGYDDVETEFSDQIY